MQGDLIIFGLMPSTFCRRFAAIGIAYLRDCGLTPAAIICRHFVAAEIRKSRMSLIFFGIRYPGRHYTASPLRFALG